MKKIDIHDFAVHDCTQELNGSPPIFPSFDKANDRLCQDNLVPRVLFYPLTERVGENPGNEVAVRKDC